MINVNILDRENRAICERLDKIIELLGPEEAELSMDKGPRPESVEGATGSISSQMERLKEKGV